MGLWVCPFVFRLLGLDGVGDVVDMFVCVAYVCLCLRVILCASVLLCVCVCVLCVMF